MTQSRKFSFQRMMMVVRFYMPSFRLAFILYPAVSLTIGILTTLLNQWEIGIIFSGLLSLILSVMLYFFPLFYCRNASPVVRTMLPATAAEKMTVLAVACLIINPILVYLPNMAASQILGLYCEPSEFLKLAGSLNTYSFSSKSLATVVNAFPPLVTCMFIVATRIRNTIGMAIGMTILTIVVYSVIAGISGAVMAIHGTLNDIASNPDFARVASDPDNPEFPGMVLRNLMPLLYTLAAVAVSYTVLMLTLAYRKMKSLQF